MHQLRDVVVRLRSGQSERKTARAAGMGRDRVAQIRERVRKLGWLDPEASMPSDVEVSPALESPPEELPAQMVSLVGKRCARTVLERQDLLWSDPEV